MSGVEESDRWDGDERRWLVFKYVICTASLRGFVCVRACVRDWWVGLRSAVRLSTYFHTRDQQELDYLMASVLGELGEMSLWDGW